MGKMENILFQSHKFLKEKKKKNHPCEIKLKAFNGNSLSSQEQVSRILG